MRTYWIRDYRDGDKLESQHEIVPGSHCYDDDPWLTDVHAREVAGWSPERRVELQVDADGWSQTLRKAQGTLTCGRTQRGGCRDCGGSGYCS